MKNVGSKKALSMIKKLKSKGDMEKMKELLDLLGENSLNFAKAYIAFEQNYVFECIKLVSSGIIIRN